MHELILVIFLLVAHPESDGFAIATGPLTDETGMILTFGSHGECTDQGAIEKAKDENVLGFVCKVQPESRNPFD